MHPLRSQLAKARQLLQALEPREKWLLLGGGGVLIVFLTIFGIFHEKILQWMAEASKQFRQVPYGWLILILLICIISFPPLIGYSAISMFTGMVFGFPNGWPVLASGTVIGSFLSFLTFRYLLKQRAEALARSNVKFMAFAKTLEQDKFTLLWLIRLCPLPYSLSNAALSSVPTVQPWRFLVATALTTPKLFLHIFIGDRVARLGEAQDSSTKVVNFVSIVIALSTGIITTYIIYNRTMQRAAELNRDGAYEYNEINDIDEMSDFEITDEEVDLGERDPFPLRDSSSSIHVGAPTTDRR